MYKGIEGLKPTHIQEEEKSQYKGSSEGKKFFPEARGSTVCVYCEP
jgi:hypothetical protein